MMRLINMLAIICLVLGMMACGEGGGKKDFDIAPIATAKADLDAKRKEMTDLRAKAETEGTPELEEQIKALDGEITAGAEALQGQISDFIFEIDSAYTDPEKEKPASYMEATHILSDEYIIIAQQYVDRQGNWNQAIAIYEEAMKSDPDYQPLKDALAQANQMKYMTKERFDLAKEGMSEQEVIAAIGRVNVNYIKDYPEDKVRAWFYPREDGGTAGVFFKEKDGAYTVYKVDFDAQEGSESPSE